MFSTQSCGSFDPDFFSYFAGNLRFKIYFRTIKTDTFLLESLVSVRSNSDTKSGNPNRSSYIGIGDDTSLKCWYDPQREAWGFIPMPKAPYR